MKVSRLLRRLMLLLLLVAGVVGIGYAALGIAARDAVGAAPEGARLARMQKSPEWRDGRFANALPRVDGSFVEMVRLWFTGGSAYREPNAAVAVSARRGTDFADVPGPGLRVTWLGHSTLLLEIDGHRVLIDPVWGERTSPFTFMGPIRFFPPPLPLAELPAIDAVVISHDHYDHLDMETVRALAPRDIAWIVPLGVGAHLAGWGVPEARIRELDWWEATHIGDLTLTATPARHFSGRSIAFTDQYRTLWSGWALTTPAHRVYYSGDTAMFPELADIGRRLGPFDLTMIEVGAYDKLWRDVHLGPEQAVRAHRIVGGKALLPVHWGLFDLALHGWTEPIERVLLAAAAEHVQVLAPRPGEIVDVLAPAPLARWWPRVPFQTVSEHDVHSSGVDPLLAAEVPARGGLSP